MQQIVWRLGCALLAAAIVATSAPVKADDAKKEMEAYEKLARPGPQHKLLASMAGSWTFTSKMWSQPGQPPVEWHGTAERKMVLGGRYLHEEVTGSFGGMPFHGISINGYDNAQDKFVGAWVDSMGTGISKSIGTLDATGKVITYEREEFDPLTKTKSKGRDVLHIVSDDKGILEFYKVLPGGKDFKMMEIEYTRKK